MEANNDSINPSELIGILWKYRLLIILTTTIFTVAGAAYSFFSTPIFQSTAVIVPPSTNSLIEIQKIQLLLTETGNDYTPATPEIVFSQYLHNLNSNRYKNSFLSRPDLTKHFRATEMNQIQARKAFTKALNIQIPKKKPYHQITLSLNTNSPERSTRWLDEYIQYSSNRFITELEHRIKSQISAAQNNLHLTIESKQANYRSNLQEEIRNLKEALEIAKEINLVEPLQIDNTFPNTQIIDQLRSTYRLGSKSIEAEIKALEARLKDRNNTPGLSDDKQKLELLASIDIQKGSIQVMTLDLPAEADLKPIKPKRMIITALAICLGILIGILAAILSNTFRSRKASM
ncbi:MAG: hypothetical protein K6L74_12585 [Neptuniibacter sp.]